MKIKIDRLSLIEKLKVFSNVIDRHAKLDSLKFTKVKVMDDKIYIIGSNGTLNVLSIMEDFTIEENGKRKEFLIEPTKANDFIQKVKSKEVELNVDEERGTITIKSGKSKIQLPSCDVNNFPKIEFKNNGNSFKIEEKEFIRNLNKVKNSVSYATNRPILNGINLKLENDSLTFQSTDSYRVSKTTINNDLFKESNDFDIVIPISTIKFIMKIMNQNEDSYIKFDVSEKRLNFQYKEYCFSTQLLEGNFPNLERIFPKEYEIEIKFIGQDFIEILRRCSIIKNEDNISNITLNIDTKEKNMKIETSIMQVGKIEDILSGFEVDKSNIENISISFNSEYLENALNSIETDEVHMKITGSLKPCVIQDLKEKDIQLILPVRTI